MRSKVIVFRFHRWCDDDCNDDDENECEWKVIDEKKKSK